MSKTHSKISWVKNSLLMLIGIALLTVVAHIIIFILSWQAVKKEAPKTDNPALVQQQTIQKAIERLKLETYSD